jgi:hypothetical protein
MFKTGIFALRQAQRDIDNTTIEKLTSLLPLPLYATLMGMPLTTAWAQIQAGKIDALQVGNRWWVPSALHSQ